MGDLVCAAHRRKNKGFPTLKRTLNLGIEKGRLLKNSRPKGGLIQVICYPTSPETVDITGFFEKFCIAIRTNLDRCENYNSSLKAIIEAWTSTKTVAELEEIITALSIPFGTIQNIAEACQHPQLQERNMIWKVYQNGMDAEIQMPGTPIKIHGEMDAPQKGAPLLGEDNQAVYQELLGLSSQEMTRLQAEQII